MATESEDSLEPFGTSAEPLGTSDSSFYGLDTASVKEYEASESLNYDDDNGILGYKASGSLIRNDNSGILRLSVQGFEFSELGPSCWEDVEISRAGHRKVAIQLLDIKNNPQDRKRGHSLVIDLDHVLLDLCYIFSPGISLLCRLQAQENAETYLLRFRAIQDVFKFQEVFTGFSVQNHIRDVRVSLPESGDIICHTAIQLWRKVPTQYESFNGTTDAPHNQPHAWIAEEGRALSEYEVSSTKADPNTASNIGLNHTNGSAMGTSASSLLVFRGEYTLRETHDGSRLSSIPLDGRVPSTSQCWCGMSEIFCKHITFQKEIDPNSYWWDFTLRNPPRDFRAVKRSAISLNVSRSLLPLAATLSTLGKKKPAPVTEDLKCVELEFRTIEDKMEFKAAYDALRRLAELDGFRRQNRPRSREVKLLSNYQPPREQGSLTRTYESAAVDTENLISTAAPKGTNTDTRLFYKPKAEVWPSMGPLPSSQRALAGHSSTRFRERPDNLASVAGRLDPITELDNRKWSSNVSDDGQLESITPSNDKAIRGVDPRLRLLDKLQCPFHFLGCKEDFHIWREQQWLKHSLTHFQTPGARRYAGLVRRIEPPKSCRCYFCKRKFSSVSGTACWKDYMNHVRHCGLGYNWVPPDSTLIEYLWQEGLISGETYQDLISIEHPPVPTCETNLAEGPEFIEFESSNSSVSETSECGELGSRSETQVSRNIQRASLETCAKREQLRRRICRRIVIFMLWKKEQGFCIPDQLWSSPASFEFINLLELSTLDKIKGLFETYSGREWNWWPFGAPAKPLKSGKVRIRWQCACGDQRWTDASEYLARKCQALVNENTTDGHKYGNATSQSARSAASRSKIGTVVPGSFPSDTAQLNGDASSICSTTQASRTQNTYNSNSKDLYVLFCVYQKSQILHSQILATKCQNDQVFFENLRLEFRRLRGFFRFWFSPLQFSHCDFVRFTRFYVNELAKVGLSLPNDLIYEYNPRPPGPHDDPPISPHEFRRRFHTPLGNPCGRSEALERIPKRQKRFQINLHVDGREDMWGLLVELQPCFLVVLMWQIAITGGGWAFMGWWLSRHHGDLQDAAMPITLIITALMALWVPIGKGMRETL